jgi:hypothetical protein
MYLRQVIHYLHFAEDFDVDLLEKAVAAAIETDDRGAVLAAVATANRRYGDAGAEPLLNAVFVPAIQYLALRNETSWVNAVWPRPHSRWIICDLSPAQADLLLAALVDHPQINYEREEILPTSRLLSNPRG